MEKEKYFEEGFEKESEDFFVRFSVKKKFKSKDSVFLPLGFYEMKYKDFLQQNIPEFYIKEIKSLDNENKKREALYSKKTDFLESETDFKNSFNAIHGGNKKNSGNVSEPIEKTKIEFKLFFITISNIIKGLLNVLLLILCVLVPLVLFFASLVYLFRFARHLFYWLI